jgi:hypothetical protein
MQNAHFYAVAKLKKSGNDAGCIAKLTTEKKVSTFLKKDSTKLGKRKHDLGKR